MKASRPRWLWRRASQLAYWASAKGFEPSDIDQAVFERFAEYLWNETLEQNRERKLRSIAKAWNQLRPIVAATTGPDAGTPPEVSVVSTRYRVSGGWGDLPATFVADIGLYCRSVASGGLLLDETGLGKPRRPALIHEIMLAAPLRLTNLMQLRIGVNLVWQPVRQDRLFLVIPQ